jgi:hypothetical protein
VLLGEDLGWRHERDLQAVLHCDQRRQQRNDRFPRADVTLEKTIHRTRPLHIVHDLLERTLLAIRQLERQNAPGRVANPVVHRDHHRLAFRHCRLAPGHHAHLKHECLFEYQSPLPRCREPIQLVEGRVLRRKMGGVERRIPRRELQA